MKMKNLFGTRFITVFFLATVFLSVQTYSRPAYSVACPLSGSMLKQTIPMLLLLSSMTVEKVEAGPIACHLCLIASCGSAVAACFVTTVGFPACVVAACGAVVLTLCGGICALPTP
jgi:hypothetical protein